VKEVENRETVPYAAVRAKWEARIAKVKFELAAETQEKPGPI